MRRALLLPLLAVALSACGGDDSETVTQTQTVAPTPATAPPADDREAILDAVVAFYTATDAGAIGRDTLRVVKTDGTFADVQVGNEAHAILKKGGDTWIVVFDGNGAIPPETRQRFGIPADYGG